MIESLKHGEQARLARKIGITPRHMNDIIKQKKSLPGLSARSSMLRRAFVLKLGSFHTNIQTPCSRAATTVPQKKPEVPDLNPFEVSLKPWAAQQYSSGFPDSTGNLDC